MGLILDNQAKKARATAGLVSYRSKQKKARATAGLVSFFRYMERRPSDYQRKSLFQALPHRSDTILKAHRII